MKQCSTIVNPITSNNEGGCISHIRTGPKMPLNQCMNNIAKASSISNPVNGHMSRTLDFISNKIPKELFELLLNDYAAVLNSNLTIFPFDKNMLIDSEHCSTFPNNSSATGDETTFEHQVFLLYNQEEQLFEPICVICPDNSEKFRFDSKEVASIWKDIGNFIDQRNREKMPFAEPTTNSDTGINDSVIDDSSASPILTDLTELCPIAEFSFLDHVFPAEASDALKNNLQVIVQLISEMAPQMNAIQLQKKKIEAVRDEFNRSSAERKIDMVIYMLKSVIEDFWIAAIPDPETGGISLKQTEVAEYLTKLDNTEKNETANAMSTKRKISSDAATSTAKRSSTVTASARSSSVPIKKYLAPTILREPPRYQHLRMFTELAQGGCPLIQAGDKNSSEPAHMEIEVPPEDEVQLHVAARAVTVEKTIHPCKSVVSKNPIIDLSLVETVGERNCLKLPKTQFDPVSQYAYFPITDDERGLRKKEIFAHLFKWKQQGTGHRARTVNGNLHMCYIEFRFCISNGSEGYEFVSDASYSSIIEESDRLVVVNPRADDNKELCERGGQYIVLPLSVTCAKQGIFVDFNGKLQSNKVFYIKGKKLNIKSPGRTPDDAKLHLKVVRHEYNELIGAKSCRTLYQDTFDFIPHNDLAKHDYVKQTIATNDDNVQ